jgi:lysine-specific demethylase/histidyl-hydroxylase NO66
VHEHPAAGSGQRGEPTTIVLEPGISMYLPTGTPHSARAQESASLHVTVGINQVTWKELLDRTLSDALAQVGAEHLPAGYLDDPDLLAGALTSKVDELVDALQGLDAAAVAAAQVRRFLTGRTMWHRAGLADRLAVRDLSDTTDLRRRPGHPCVSFLAGDRLRVLLGDRELDMPAWLDAAMAAVGERTSLRPADLADLLDEQSRLVLCRRLVREGLLEVVA